MWRLVLFVHFTPEEFSVLERAIEKLREQVSEIKKSIGESCKLGAETFHDNFEFEEAHRSLPLWEIQLKYLVCIRKEAKIVHPDPHDEKAGIGKTIKVYDEFLKHEYEFKIGSFLILTPCEGLVSLQSPLAESVYNAVPGEVRTCEINGSKRTLKILSIS